MRTLGELEAAAMEQLWAAEQPMTVRELYDAVTARGLAYTTISTVLENLHRKGFAARSRQGRLWYYRPARSRAEYEAGLMREALEGSADPSATLLRFVGDISADEADMLKAMLAEHERTEVDQ